MAEKRTATPKRRWWVWLLGLVVVVVVGFFAFPFVMDAFLPAPASAQSLQPSPDQLVEVTTGDIATTISASGSLLARRAAALSLTQQGEVETVHVAVGSMVKKGDPLIDLDKTELERSVRNAEQSLIIQQNSLAALTVGATPEEIAAAQSSLDSANTALTTAQQGASQSEIAAAQANLASAQAALADLQAGPDTATITSAQAELDRAEVALQAAQAAYDQVSWRNDVSATQPAADLQAATIDYEVAKANYDEAMKGPSAEEIAQAEANVASAQSSINQLLNDPNYASNVASAESQVASAQSSLASLTAGATAEDLSSAQAQVEQAQISLETAQANLEAATLYAPFDGMVTAVYVTEGEQASGTVVDMIATDSLEVSLTVDEVDLGAVEIGQQATVILETYPDTPIPAEVVSIDPIASSEAGSTIATFTVYLKLGDTDKVLRVGMTANADLVTAEHTAVLLIPNNTLTADRAAGKYYVNVWNGTAVERREVQIGLRNGDFTEIVSGVNAGDQLVTSDYVAAADSSQQQQGGFLFGGGGGPRGGGAGPAGNAQPAPDQP